VVDGLKGFPDAIQAAFPDAMVQTCIVHYADLRIMPPAPWNPALAAMIAATGSA